MPHVTAVPSLHRRALERKSRAVAGFQGVACGHLLKTHVLGKTQRKTLLRCGRMLIASEPKIQSEFQSVEDWPITFGVLSGVHVG